MKTERLSLYIRQGERVTFMEAFDDVDCRAAAHIEALARHQDWCKQLGSPRCVETFIKERS